jgi:hypothetical protein
MSGFPLIPGYQFPDPSNHRFHKSQALVFENGGPAIHENAPGIGGKLLSGQTVVREAVSSTAVYNEALGSDYRTGETVPAWVAFGSQVLRFYGYFKEPIFSSQDENYRVRQVIILFFLEDDTLQILEPRQRNSGIPQGTFLRRHRAKKEDDNYVTVADLRVGGEFTIYGRTYFVSDADVFTLDFMSKLKREGDPASDIPEDPYMHKRNLREYEETHRQRGVPKPEMLKLRQFLANDGRVLRFYAFWDDREKPFGDLRRFIVNYFLADDTMEVREALSSNDGRDPFPSFVRRSQVPKEVLPLSENDPRFLSADHYYRPQDFKIGQSIDILNRTMYLYDCDQFTRKWYIENFGYTTDEMAPLTAPQIEKKKAVVHEIPPPALIGSDEDTIRSCLSLHPKPPPKDEMKLITRMHDVLRFKAKLVTKNAIDATREFIMTFYLSDDTVQIYEPPQRNSGIVAGKFLQRTKIKNVETGEYFKAPDLEIGKVITINKFKFVLLEATEYAMSYMEADPLEFQQADLSAVIDRLRYGIRRSGKTPKELFLQYSDHGRMDLDDLTALCEALGVQISPHEAVTVMRRYEKDMDAHTFTLREFLTFTQ